MFTHVRVGSSDPRASIAFYDATFAALGISGQHHEATHAMYGTHDSGMFMVGPPADGEAATHANGGTIGLAAPSAEAVHAWHAAGLANGGTCEGPPGPRDYGEMPMVGAYLRDPAGNKLCAFWVDLGE
ncbi:VOC family protein [Alteraurantiacibacter aquimixticola]|uniref:VOC family protein n=1 Tax=Alteraurantiacibacter aquimixticola TaxID=2489173 RepID=A0A4T3EYW6_9SPHN|nr:VOC family protein [Alteraurantiacibacter aquimixticola]TIX49846.1 VOC family protein [Alteraurantiacibacter aquimixticola]